jgi:hypothetical protein
LRVDAAETQRRRVAKEFFIEIESCPSAMKIVRS